ncbi:hydroxymethylglutaryl-CoA lyase [Herbaspirillum seropedicae]|uniref:hydroxymethylglutaryl-CoA lyase n=1 Tax=Herbaspirillum seropedicae TaxID=964 RepID=UPI003F8D7F2E
MNSRGNKVIVQEVGLRDGLQSLSQVMATDDKKRWIDAAYAAGVRHIEAASFVPPRLLPQMADAQEVIAHALSYPGLTVTALVPNLKGAQRALEAGVHRIVAPVSVSAAHSQANVRKSPQEMVEELHGIRLLIDEAPAKPILIAGLSTAFGCPLQGQVPVDEVVQVSRLVLQAGCDLLALGDTTGHATPGQADDVLRAVRQVAGDKLAIAHFHDTRGLGLANTLIALEHGIREFDATLGGIGGCPHAPGASGNIATEDLIFMLDSLHYHSGIDLIQLLAMRELLQQSLPGVQLYGSLARAGLPQGYATPHPLSEKAAA